MSKMYTAKILWNDNSKSISLAFLSREEAENELRAMSFAMEDRVLEREIIEEDKTNLPPELSVESVFYALGGPDEQVRECLHRIISRCNYWSTEEATELMQEAND